MFASLFTTNIVISSVPCERAKRHRSSRTSEGEDARTQKNERINLEVVRRSLLLHKEACQMRSRELVVGASSSRVEVVARSTTEDADTVVSTTEGVPTEGVGFEKPDPPSC